MRTPDIEGVAIHDGPESCAGVCEGDGEALTGVRAGQPWSREITASGCRRRPKRRKAILPAALARAVRWTLRGLGNLCVYGVLPRENREVPLLACPVDHWVGRSGKTEVVGLRWTSVGSQTVL
jgi:RNA-directed DNA polymerase